MPDFPKVSDLQRIFRDEAVSRSQRLTVNAVDRDGSDANIMGWSAAVVGEEVIGQLADVEDGFWLASARGAKLDKWAADRYGLYRKAASPAFVYLQFSTTAGAPAAFSIPAGTRAATSDGREFVTVVTTAYPLGGVGPVSVLARSVLAGLNQAIGPSALRSLKTAIPSAPADLAVTNAEASSGGTNVESDDDFKVRISRFWVAARRGTKGAVETGALAVPGVRTAVAFEGLQSFGYPTRTLTLVVTDSFTEALVKQGVAVPTYETQSQALAYVVRNSLGEHRAYGIPVNVLVAQVRLVGVVLRLRFTASTTNTDAVALYARTLVVQYVNTLRSGASFEPAAVTSILRTVAGLEIFGDEVASPVGAVIPSSPYQVLRTSLALVTTDSQATVSALGLT